jgi:gliding motility-associated-like protein
VDRTTTLRLRCCLILLTLITSQLHAQTFMQLVYPLLPADTEEPTYTVKEVLPTTDGGVLLLGNDEFRGYMCKMDAAGAIEWGKVLALPPNDLDTIGVLITSGLVASNSDIILSIRFGTSDNSLGQLGLLRFSADGSLQLARQALAPNVSVNMIEEVDTGFLMGGYRVETLGYSNFYLLLDSQLSIVEGKAFYYPDWFNFVPLNNIVYKEPSITFWASAFEDFSGSDPDNISTIITKYDFEEGQFSHLYTNANGFVPGFSGIPITDIATDEEGSRYISSTNDGNYILSKYNNNDSLLWAKQVSAQGKLRLTDTEIGILIAKEIENTSVAGWLYLDKETGAQRPSPFHLGLGTTYEADRAQSDDGSLFWSAFVDDAAVVPANAFPTMVVKTNAQGNLDDCKRVETCNDEVLDIVPPPITPTGPFQQNDMVNFTLISLNIIVEDQAFGRLPYCTPFEKTASFELDITEICPGDSVSVSGTSSSTLPSTFAWAAEGASPDTSTREMPFFTFLEAGNFDIAYVHIVEGCGDSIFQPIEVLEPPVFDLGVNSFLCDDDTLLLESGLDANVVSLLWQDNSTQPNLLVENAGLYILQATNDLGCTSRDSVQVLAVPKPDFSLGDDLTICIGDSIQIMPDLLPFEGVFEWSTGDSTTTIWIDEIGEYSLTITDETTGCSDTDSLELKLSTVPPFTYAPLDAAFCVGDQLVLTARAQGNTDINFSWGEGLEGESFVVPDTGTYTLLAFDGLCMDTLRVVIPQGDCPANIYLPTAFSPNDDGRNDLFEALGPDIETVSLKIFNRWGGLVFEGNGANSAWDGRIAGEDAPGGTYVYILEYLNLRSLESFQKSGQILLVR